MASPGARPRTIGIDPSRAALLMAVVDKRTDIDVDRQEAFLAAVGGLILTEPAIDLAVAFAVASSATGARVHPDLVIFGELGLAGEVRGVPNADRRLAEAVRAGFTRAVVPASTPHDAVPTGMRVHRARTLNEALMALGGGADI